MTSRQQNSILIWAQILLWICVLLLPAAGTMFFGRADMALGVLKGSVASMLPLMLLYFFNFLYLIPKFLFGGKKGVFYAVNSCFVLAYLAVRTVLILKGRGDIPPQFSVTGVVVMQVTMTVVSVVLALLLAVGFRYVMRWNEMQIRLREEEKQKKEAELTWLKYQLNPHFLFNTMNNISSLTQINPDQAQESIGRLSDVLRYAIYGTENATVPLSGEIAFMEDYISLMQLRCNELATVSVEMHPPKGDVQIAPLLFISLIENAFKHGVNARQESFVSIRLQPEGEDIVFECANSVFPESDGQIGSGIGLDNLKQRLELLYPGKHSYEQSSNEREYRVKLVLKDIVSNG